jgi:hypothetical protein
VIHRLQALVASRRAERRAIAEYRSAWRRLTRLRATNRLPEGSSSDVDSLATGDTAAEAERRKG